MAMDPALQTVLDIVVRRLAPREVILFGSRARGGAGPDSDYDLLVVVDDATMVPTPRNQLTGAVYADLIGCDVPPVDLLVYGQSEAARWRRSVNHVVARATEEGQVLYARP